MIQIELIEISNADHEWPLSSLHRLQPPDGWVEVHHLYDYDGSYGLGEEGWNWGEEEYDEDEGEYFSPLNWSANAVVDDGWSYLFTFRDGSQGVSRVSDVNAALRALGYEVDRRGDAP